MSATKATIAVRFLPFSEPENISSSPPPTCEALQAPLPSSPSGGVCGRERLPRAASPSRSQRCRTHRHGQLRMVRLKHPLSPVHFVWSVDAKRNSVDVEKHSHARRKSRRTRAESHWKSFPRLPKSPHHIPWQAYSAASNTDTGTNVMTRMRLIALPISKLRKPRRELRAFPGSPLPTPHEPSARPRQGRSAWPLPCPA